MSVQLALFDVTQSKAEVHRDYLGIPGLIYCPGFVSLPEQSALLSAIDQHDWRNDLSRRVQHFGYKYDYKSRRVDETMFVGPLPPFAVELGRRLVEQNLISQQPDQVIVNEYKPGQGIAAHVDCEPCFKDYIVTVSLGSVYTMDLLDTASDDTVELTLELGSALVLSGESRYRWKHGIKARKTDNGRQRGRRVSLTFRSVILSSKSSAISGDSDQLCLWRSPR